jgi:hypothetical protein
VRTAPLPLLGTLVGHVRAHRWRLVVFATLGAAVATAVFFAAPPRYVATSSVALSPHLTYLAQSTRDKKPSFVSVDTVATLVDSDAVIQPIADALQVSPDEARRSTTVTAQPLSTVLRIHVEGSTRRFAQAGSSAAAKALLHEQSRIFHLKSERVRLIRKRVGTLRAAVTDRTYAGLDVTRTNKVLALLTDRLGNAITTNRPSSVLLHEYDVRQVRGGQLPVYTTAGLAAGAVLAWLVPAPASLRRLRRRASTPTRTGFTTAHQEHS